MSRTRVTLVLASVCLTLVVLPAAAQTPLQVGDVYDANIPTPSNYPPSSAGKESAWVYEFTHPDATYISLHFSDFYLGWGDYLVVSDALGNQSYRMGRFGKMRAGTFWAQHIKGDTVRLELVTTTTGGGTGFTIDQYAAGFVSLGEPPTEAICSNADFENAACRRSSTEYDRGRAVARLLIAGARLCTGFLASGNNHLITNEHCITGIFEALNTDYEFDAEAPTCGTANCQLCYPGAIFSGSSFIQDNPELDYALVQLNGNPSATYGYLELENRTASVGEEIYIVGHPYGRAKEFSYASDTGPTGATGAGTVVSTSEPGCLGSSPEVGYWTDTEAGSSGSPVLAVSSQKVIALHHCRGSVLGCGNPNRGVPIDQICDEICGILGLPECAVNGECNDGDSCTLDTCVSGSCSYDPIVGCCGNGTCESNEDCRYCPADCISSDGTSSYCGDGSCDELTENCESCPADCNGRTRGKPSRRFCCGDGGGDGPIDCSDDRCYLSGNTCGAPIPFCCGNDTCEGAEDNLNCAIDCLSP
jgi:hypothetical protein